MFSSARLWLIFFGGLGLLMIAPGDLAAQNEMTSYVWLFDATGTDADNLVETITEEFEEALITTGCIPIVRRRNLPELQDHQRQEQRIAGADYLSPRQRRLLSTATAYAVVFGKITDDVQGGQIKIAVTLEALSGVTLASSSVRIIRGKRFDAEERERRMQELAWAVCGALGFRRAESDLRQLSPHQGVDNHSTDNNSTTNRSGCESQFDQYIFEDVKISFEEIRFNGDTLEVNFVLTNEGSAERRIMLFGGGPVFGHDPSRIFGGGEEYHASGIVFGKQEDQWRAYNILPPSVALKAKLSFRGVPRSLESVGVLELNYNNGDGGYKSGSAVFRGICLD